MLFIFTINFFLRTYGAGSVRVIAPNPVEALRLAAGTEAGWMLLDSHVDVSSITRGFIAKCEHHMGSGTGNGTFECEDCPTVWPVDGDHPAPSATNQGFRVYCESIIESGRF